ncbi:hypothetical protein BS47DRAFT_1396969 [Hydnum rufescens UP504]|uniref:Aminoglycoside phosphotransferase domain-containing protein n=1 Tax=Hydnum rufescens UP504 TaxID=1448309 RepID=A0A9P6AP73_9AGAM|nr:hypothetical protein BS47DRAFT_1396969 [Hydnum rufescens UP504]
MVHSEPIAAYLPRAMGVIPVSTDDNVDNDDIAPFPDDMLDHYSDSEIRTFVEKAPHLIMMRVERTRKLSKNLLAKFVDDRTVQDLRFSMLGRRGSESPLFIELLTSIMMAYILPHRTSSRLHWISELVAFKLPSHTTQSLKPCPDLCLEPSRERVFAHLDLVACDIVIDAPNHWIIDWGFAGYYPKYMECMRTEAPSTLSPYASWSA